MSKLILIFFSLTISLYSCSKKGNDGPSDTIAPKVSNTIPVNGATKVLISSEISVTYNEPVILEDGYSITINGDQATATVSGNKLIIAATLVNGKTYNVSIGAKTVSDQAGNGIPAYSFSFTTADKVIPLTNGKYEAEDATLSSALSVQTSINGYSGTGFVGGFQSMSDMLTFNIEGVTAGKYDIYVGYSTSSWGTKICNVDVNGLAGTLELTASTGFTEKIFTTITLKAGANVVKITPNWTWFTIDYIRFVPNTSATVPFNIDAGLITPNPSSQSVNVYNYLKATFQSKVLSGTMANYATNINEATWVNQKTGKWPALTTFDFIEYTHSSNTVDYNAIYDLGSDWWNNKGLVSLMWHWRDPLNKSGAFYTSDTQFDVSKISDTTSVEYKAMITDIDTIAAYLKKFKDANIPVLWRPLHEAAGGWFWWGAKGAEPCKALWKLMFNRLVNYHGLNNLIWIWTTNSNGDAFTWYPGNDYVDIVGMDIYPGENQHNSQVFEFNKVKQIFEGRKIITLSECGSVPDPEQMFLYGDTWSWFMPWNGDYTESDKHNGATWWINLMGNSHVVTRDQMPNLK